MNALKLIGVLIIAAIGLKASMLLILGAAITAVFIAMFVVVGLGMILDECFPGEAL